MREVRIAVPEELLARLDALAVRRGTGRSELIRLAVERLLDALGEPPSESSATPPRDPLGSMRGTGSIVGDIDEPAVAEEEWEVLGD